VSVPPGLARARLSQYTENYRSCCFLAVLAVCGVILYLVLRSPVIVSKEAVGIVKEEGSRAIKVRIFIRTERAPHP